MSFRIFIDGEAGTTGLRVAARLQAHPHVELLHIDEAQRKDSDARLQLMQDSDITILCLPDAAAREAVALADGDASIRFIDASTAHRVDDSWVYGFPELTTAQRSMIAAASRIANPGCYPTGFLALAKPLIGSGMLPADSHLSVPAISGCCLTGALARAERSGAAGAGVGGCEGDSSGGSCVAVCGGD